MQVCQAWSEYNFYIPNREDYHSQYVLNNSHIKINNRLFFSKSLLDSKAITVNDFFDNAGKPLEYTQFIRQHKVINFPFTIFFGIIKAIPRYWRGAYSEGCSINYNQQGFTKFMAAPKPSKYMYNFFALRNIQIPTYVAKWESELKTPIDWNTVFRMPFITTKDSKLQYFQFRFIHRILPVNDLLYKMKLCESVICTFCSNEAETIDHLFWSCSYIQSFWRDAINICIKEPSDFFADKMNIFFGIPQVRGKPLNFFIIHAKHYIFASKLNGKRPCPMTFRNRFQFVLKVEKYIQQNMARTNFDSFREAFVIH